MRGTTQTLTYQLPFSTELVAKAKLVIARGGAVLLRKDTPQLILEGNTVTANFSREETVKLPEDADVLVQLEVQTLGGEHLVTAPARLYTGQLLDEGALV